jgi:uncharacterized oxidoreductase
MFAAAGTPDDIADYVARTLITANLMGHDSHGVIRVIWYLNQVRDGELMVDAQPEIRKQHGAVAVIDCRRGYGQIGARMGAQVACDLAGDYGIGCVSITNINHVGRLGEYAGWLAGQGRVAIVLSAFSWTSVTPYGGREGILGTNPMAWAVPTRDDPLVLDFATSIVAAGKIQVALDEDREVPAGWLLDRDGLPTQNPSNFRNGGVLLPFGTYKGYGLNLMMELIPTLLGGLAPATSPEFEKGNPTLILALNIEAFTDMERFVRLADELRARVKQVPPAQGFDEVLLPGEPEARSMAQRQRDGIPVAEKTWAALTELATEYGVTVPV